MNSKNYYYLSLLKQFFKYLCAFAPVIVFIFVILTTIQFLSQTRNGLAEEKWILVGIFMIIVEVFNQITYYAAKKYPKLPIIKGVVILLTFFIFTGLYLYWITQLPVIRNYNNISTNISELLVNLLGSLFFPLYCFSSGIRFWLLYGKFTKHAKF